MSIKRALKHGESQVTMLQGGGGEKEQQRRKKHKKKKKAEETRRTEHCVNKRTLK